MRKSGFKVAAMATGATLLLAVSAQAVVIEGGEATGAPGDTVDVSVTLATEGSEVAGTENVVGWATDAGVAVAAKTNGKPDCAVNPDIEKGGTAFAFQPSGCTAGTDCTGVKALVLALDNVDPIPNDSVLYTCKVAIASNATAGNKTLSILSPGASDPAGGALTTTGSDARVIVTGGAADADIIVGDASGAAGSTVAVDVTLSTGADVAGTENIVAFSAPLTVAAKTNGKPDCAVNPDIEKGGTAFAYQPSGCTVGTDCTGVKALVLALDNVDPIPDDSVLYTCQVAIAADAEAGDYTLGCTDPGASDPAGGALNAACTDGTITVEGGEVPTATPTETMAPPGTPTNTPLPTNTATRTATHTRTIGPPAPGGNDDDGCAIVAPAQSSNAWMLLLPAAALLWLRRRPR